MVELFQPQLSVEPGEGETFVVHAATPTPNSCYGAGEPRLGDDPPDGDVGVPETRHLSLPLTHQDGFCLQQITTVHHRISVPPSPERDTISASVTLDGRVLGSASIRLPDPDESGEQRQVVDVREVNAWVDAQPPGEPTLHVEASVMLPDPGYDVDLVPARDAAPDDGFALRLDVTELEGVFPSVVSTQSVEFTRTGLEPETVVIYHPDGSETTVDVQRVV